MMMTGTFVRFLKEHRGAAAAEFALLAVVLAGVLIGIIDFNRLSYERNKLEKACQVGARFAVENYMVATGMANFDCQAAGIAVGATIQESDLSPNSAMCDATTCTAWGPHDLVAYNAILAEMGSVTQGLTDPGVAVEVTYNHIGMGFCGNPFGPDVWPLTTVTVTGWQYDFATPLVGALFGSPTLECTATLTGEDFQTCPDGVSQPPCS